MSFRITVTECKSSPELITSQLTVETEIFRQTVEDLDIRKFARDINKTPRTRKAKAPKSGN